MKSDKNDKPKIIKIAQNIMKNAPDIPMYKAIILAATTFTLGISTGACINNIMHSKQERKTSISEELDSSDIIEAGSILNVKFSNNLDRG